MQKIGITGGIGSGKSFICSVFKQLNTPIYNADERARNITNTSIEVINNIKKLLGNNAYTNNILDRKYVASLVFDNKNLLMQLNNIIHPAVDNDFLNWCKLHSSKKYILKEAAILFETGIYKKLDKNIVVAAPEELRIQRVIQRDNISKENIQNRIKNQWSTEKTIPLADFIINNDGNDLILPQIIKIHNTLNK